MQVVGLVPLGHHIGARGLASFNNGARIGAVVGIDVDNAVAACFGENRLDIGNAFFTVAFGHKRYIFSTHCLGESSAALVPSCVIGIGQKRIELTTVGPSAA